MYILAMFVRCCYEVTSESVDSNEVVATVEKLPADQVLNFKKAGWKLLFTMETCGKKADPVQNIEVKLPTGWIICDSARYKKRYFFNKNTGVSKWSIPTIRSKKAKKISLTNERKMENKVLNSVQVKQVSPSYEPNKEIVSSAHSKFRTKKRRKRSKHKSSVNSSVKLSSNPNVQKTATVPSSVTSTEKKIEEKTVDELNVEKNKNTETELTINNGVKLDNIILNRDFANSTRTVILKAKRQLKSSTNSNEEDTCQKALSSDKNSKSAVHFETCYGMSSNKARHSNCRTITITNTNSPNSSSNKRLLSLTDNSNSIFDVSPVSNECSTDVEMLDLSQLLMDDMLQPMQTDEIEPSNDSLFIVVDTNVFLNSLKWLKTIVEIQKTDYGNPIIIIPWVVIQELDSLKNNRSAKGLSQKAAEAVSYVFKMLKSRHPRLRGQTAADATVCEQNLNAECNDDKILQCCLQLAKKFGVDHVILLTSDKNLSNKAIINKLEAHTCTTLAKHLKFDLNSRNKTQMQETSSVESSKQNAQERIKAMKDVISKAEEITKDLLSYIVETEMKEAFGDIWIRIVFIKPPWTLENVLKCFLKHWMALFGYLFKRDMKEVAENLLSLTRNGLRNFEDEGTTTQFFELTSTVCLNIYLKFGLTSADDALKSLTELKNKWYSLFLNTGNDSKILKEDPDAVLKSFNYVWDCINYLCGVTIDVLEQPSLGIVYNKPEVLPSRKEVGEMLPRFHKKLQTLNQKMRSIVLLNDKEDSYYSRTMSEFWEALTSFTDNLKMKLPDCPYLKIITVKMLKEYCNSSANEEILKNGCHQLIKFCSKTAQLMGTFR